MSHEDFEDIEWLTREIEYSLNNSEFTELASLSLRLQSIVQKLTENTDREQTVNERDLEKLEKLLTRVRKYQVQTELKFKEYTLKISKQTKMHNAYKQG